jgi:hypothetical protein
MSTKGNKNRRAIKKEYKLYPKSSTALKRLTCEDNFLFQA